jgi:hypothetical protein
VKFEAAVAPVAVPSEIRTLEGAAFAIALNPVPDDPEVPEDPEVPDEPLVPDVPEEPLVPDEPDVPDEPLDPDDPDVPDVPDLPATDISTSISSPEVGVHPVPETYATWNSQYNPASAGLLVTL